MDLKSKQFLDHPNLSFCGLEQFGISFLSYLKGSQMSSSLLHSITLVDTPGILLGVKQLVNQGYNCTKVVAWFAKVR